MGNLLLILAVLASAAAILQIVARQGMLGPTVHGWAAQYSHAKETIILACVLWAAWYVLADFPLDLRRR
jgi:hypothetical protein